MTQSVVPELYDILTQYTASIKTGALTTKRAISSSSPVFTFCLNFYAQFFQNQLAFRIERLDDEAKRSAVRLRLQLKDSTGSSEVIKLLALFEKLCDKRHEIMALDYGVGSKVAFFDFHEDYLPDLLTAIAAWAVAENHNDVNERVKRERAELLVAIGGLPR